jgi:hypothetical protein
MHTHTYDTQQTTTNTDPPPFFNDDFSTVHYWSGDCDDYSLGYLCQTGMFQSHGDLLGVHALHVAWIFRRLIDNRLLRGIEQPYRLAFHELHDLELPRSGAVSAQQPLATGSCFLTTPHNAEIKATTGSNFHSWINFTTYKFFGLLSCYLFLLQIRLALGTGKVPLRVMQFYHITLSSIMAVLFMDMLGQWATW